MDPFGAEATAALPRTTTPLRMVPSLSAMMRSNHSASNSTTMTRATPSPSAAHSFSRASTASPDSQQSNRTYAFEPAITSPSPVSRSFQPISRVDTLLSPPTSTRVGGGSFFQTNSFAPSPSPSKSPRPPSRLSQIASSLLSQNASSTPSAPTAPEPTQPPTSRPASSAQNEPSAFVSAIPELRVPIPRVVVHTPVMPSMSPINVNPDAYSAFLQSVAPSNPTINTAAPANFAPTEAAKTPQQQQIQAHMAQFQQFMQFQQFQQFLQFQQMQQAAQSQTSQTYRPSVQINIMPPTQVSSPTPSHADMMPSPTTISTAMSTANASPDAVTQPVYESRTQSAEKQIKPVPLPPVDADIAEAAAYEHSFGSPTSLQESSVHIAKEKFVSPSPKKVPCASETPIRTAVEPVSVRPSPRTTSSLFDMRPSTPLSHARSITASPSPLKQSAKPSTSSLFAMAPIARSVTPVMSSKPQNIPVVPEPAPALPAAVDPVPVPVPVADPKAKSVEIKTSVAKPSPVASSPPTVPEVKAGIYLSSWHIQPFNVSMPCDCAEVMHRSKSSMVSPHASHAQWFDASGHLYVRLIGINTQTKTLWSTSPIRDHVTNRVVKTDSGSLYGLTGAMDRQKALQYFPASILDQFNDGFPSDWHSKLYAYISKGRVLSEDRPINPDAADEVESEKQKPLSREVVNLLTTRKTKPQASKSPKSKSESSAEKVMIIPEVKPAELTPRRRLKRLQDLDDESLDQDDAPAAPKQRKLSESAKSVEKTKSKAESKSATKAEAKAETKAETKSETKAATVASSSLFSMPSQSKATSKTSSTPTASDAHIKTANSLFSMFAAAPSAKSPGVVKPVKVAEKGTDKPKTSSLFAMFAK